MTETMDYKGYKIETEQDVNAEDPRDWGTLGTMVCFHKRYTLGDETDLKSKNFDSWDEVKKYLYEELNAVIVLPL